jgi:hypothetical protein
MIQKKSPNWEARNQHYITRKKPNIPILSYGYGKMLTKLTFVSQSGIAAIPSRDGKGTQIFPCLWKFASEFSMELPSLQQVLQATKVRPHPPGQK